MKIYDLSFNRPVSVSNVLGLIEKYTGAKKHVAQFAARKQYFTVHLPGLTDIGMNIHPGADFNWEPWPSSFEELFSRTSASFRIHIREGLLEESVIVRIDKKINEGKDMA